MSQVLFADDTVVLNGSEEGLRQLVMELRKV